MLQELKPFIGAIAVFILFLGYAPYIANTLREKTRPHAFSWFIWGILDTIAGIAQFSDGGGAGAWVTACGALVSFSIFLLALFKGERSITQSDWASFFVSLISIPIWCATNDPLWSVIIVTLIDLVAFWPTIRKSYYKPYEETAITYWLSSAKSLLSLLALERYTLVTVIYPTGLSIGMLSFLVMLHYRRRAIRLNEV